MNPAGSLRATPFVHLDPLSLDAARAGELSGEQAEHLEGCERCRREVEALRAFAANLRGRAVEVPEAADRAVLALAALHLGRRRKPGFLSLAAAAAILMAAGLGLHFTRNEHAAFDPMDLDRDGTLDMVDAYLIARDVQRGRGSFVPADVAEAARRSVALGGSR